MEICIAILSATSALGSMLAALFTFLNSRKMSFANMEMQIRQMIATAKFRMLEYTKTTSNVETVLLNALDEEVMCAYDEACAKYLDNKVDKERFRRMYTDEIRQIVEDENHKEKYDQLQSKYKATVKVYKMWFDREKI